ncbi:ubiquitin-activating enzyme E1 [Vavraia culicis subsp. floridensis]|uniref:Ubiquitin-activating enzyme E1 n=1 Tax=Vavraia culicis (isolate floridensis) TaxID=948595 RepID=L2GVF4_VAVCU|nr:ubiquitin-activating enzyme E1 [Vavraia culicis subsp. floridensis]ELA47651.1 ubiquitin-activating enzyme E1 [Vavraia culicis subsp. floridensis]
MQTDATGSSINESLYSRQLLVLGPKAHVKMMQSKVLIVGMSGLGQEIAKNLILAGIRTDIYDNSLVRMNDLNTGFYFQSQNVGQRKDESVLNALKELNTYVHVGICDIMENEGMREDVLKNYTLLVQVDADLRKQERANEATRRCNIGFIGCMQKGLAGCVFNDFIHFTTRDVNGESPKLGSVTNISYERKDDEYTEDLIEQHRRDKKQKTEEHNVYTLRTVDRHNFESRDRVKVGDSVFSITVINPFEFQICTTGTVEGDTYEEIKKTKVFEFKSLAECGKEENDDIFKLFYTHALFRDEHGRDPFPRDESDREKFLEIYEKNYGKASSELPGLFAETCAAAFMPIVSILGGYVAQEALKLCSERFMPLLQFYFFNSYDLLLPDLFSDKTEEESNKDKNKNVDLDDYKHEDSKFRDLVVLFGNRKLDQILNAKIFLVGAGAIGCEHLKNLISDVTVTDMDTIEESNLNRQFLFRKKDISDFKSAVAANVICQMREETRKDKIVPYTLAVNSNTENIFNDCFLSKFDLFALALDNAEARQYMDGRAVILKKPLFDGGTLGTKGNAQCVIPYLTESYSSSRDPPEKEIPLCTVRNFPHLIEHCIEWALTQFQTLFTEVKQNNNSDESRSANVVDESGAKSDEVKLGENLLEYIGQNPPCSKKECIKYAVELFVCFFKTNIQKLKELFPEDHITEEGLRFWEPPKRVPTEIELSEGDELHLLFLLSCSNLLSTCYLDGRKVTKDDFCDDMDEEPCDNIQKKKIIFEKDDDRNWHVDFVYAASNLRAQNYKIKNAERLDVKRIAGKIIPAIATTTAVVSGLICIEMYRYLFNKDKLSESHENEVKEDELQFIQIRRKSEIIFKNSFINLALPFIAHSETLPPIEFECKLFNKKFNLWDQLEVKDCTIEQFIQMFADVTVEMISHGNKLLYCSFYDMEKNERYYRKNIMSTADENCDFVVLDVLFDVECDHCMNIIVKR